MKQYILFLIMMLLSWAASAQNLSVASFNELPNDLDAKIHFPKIFTQTNTKCALIKVVNTNQGFTFDVGSLPVVTSEVHEDVGETWVYVPEGVKKIKIAHPQLGQLNTSDGYYWFPIALKSAVCYRLVLTSDNVITIIEDVKKPMGWLIIKSKPSDADIYLTQNGKESLVGNTSNFQRKVEYGEYRYRLTKTLFHDEVGIVQVNQGRVEITPTLTPAHGRISITSNPAGAKVEVDGLRETYTTPCTTDVLASGTYTLRLSKEKYSRAQQQVTVQDNQITPVSVDLNANFSKITVTSIPQAEIYLNGSRVATGSYSDDLIPGIYDFEARLNSHKPATRQIKVTANNPQNIALNPTPIYGSIDVVTHPMDAQVSINGKTYGTTPTTIENILVGNYTVTLSKEGYASVLVNVEVTEGNTAEINSSLSNGRDISFSSTPSGALLYIDDKCVGVTPATLPLNFGNHSVKLSLDDAVVTDNITVSDNAIQNNYYYELNGSEQVFTINGISFKMIKVEGGIFTMGATSEQGSEVNSDEIPVHQVTLSSYYIGQTEVTQALWKSVMGNSPSAFKGSYLPVEGVSWDDCQKFIRKLNQKTGKNFRLPTEAEWEYAARGGRKSRTYRYSGSNEIDDVAWYTDNSNGETHQVGIKKPNELGIHDMTGNVWEWCQDWYNGGYYDISPNSNPQGPQTGTKRVYRGGSWGSNNKCSRLSYRIPNAPNNRYGFIGLRLVLEP